MSTKMEHPKKSSFHQTIGRQFGVILRRQPSEQDKKNLLPDLESIDTPVIPQIVNPRPEFRPRTSSPIPQPIKFRNPAFKPPTPPSFSRIDEESSSDDESILNRPISQEITAPLCGEEIYQEIDTDDHSKIRIGGPQEDPGKAKEAFILAYVLQMSEKLSDIHRKIKADSRDKIDKSGLFKNFKFTAAQHIQLEDLWKDWCFYFRLFGGRKHTYSDLCKLVGGDPRRFLEPDGPWEADFVRFFTRDTN